MIVRRAQITDASQLAEVSVNSIRATYERLVPNSVLESLSIKDNEAKFRQRIAEGHSHMFVAEAYSQIIGFATLGDKVEKGEQGLTGQLYAIYLDPKWWRRGAGWLLWNEAIGCARSLGWIRLKVKTATGNTRACRFYEAMGCVANVTSIKESDYLGVTVETIQYILVL